MKIVIVDDSKMLRQRIIEMLSDIPEVEIAGEAENANEAIKIIELVKPDILILDIRMPGGSGLEVLKSIQQKKLSMINILFTNYPLDQYKKKCFELGVDYFFDKSTEFEAVKKVIEDLANSEK